MDRHLFISTLAETWSNTQTVDDYYLKGYDVCHKVRNNKKGGGVACYVNKELASKYIHHKSISHLFSP